MLPSDGDNPLRDEIFALLNTAKVPIEQVLEALSQCQAQITNRILVERTAKECGLRLSRFLTNKDLELYYDLKQGRHDVGYISKGWNDPGFRVGDLFDIPKHKLPQLKDNILTLLKCCATRGVSVTIDETKDGVQLHMDSVIYSDGFNKRVFEQVLHYVNVCVHKAEELMG
jgi:hypothetical protein